MSTCLRSWAPVQAGCCMRRLPMCDVEFRPHGTLVRNELVVCALPCPLVEARRSLLLDCLARSQGVALLAHWRDFAGRPLPDLPAVRRACKAVSGASNPPTEPHGEIPEPTGRPRSNKGENHVWCSERVVHRASPPQKAAVVADMTIRGVGEREGVARLVRRSLRARRVHAHGCRGGEGGDCPRARCLRRGLGSAGGQLREFSLGPLEGRGASGRVGRPLRAHSRNLGPDSGRECGRKATGKLGSRRICSTKWWHAMSSGE